MNNVPQLLTYFANADSIKNPDDGVTYNARVIDNRYNKDPNAAMLTMEGEDGSTRVYYLLDLETAHVSENSVLFKKSPFTIKDIVFTLHKFAPLHINI